ncbi:hypothetical protein JNB63_02165 [Microbacterium trichothecenolyticum]|uniref:hypothetical protein n=1 Tax=Microbacterium trichothecenolyticum TaxID=69370 RepID=UPI001C6E768C|nr:hypothetical protein [Microbacterium trichothecenolyticum]MBW9118891.1 hypothetical protein [Microbacterium trichothecenolyticum]
MSDVPVWASELDEILAGVCIWRSRVTSWLGGRMLAASVPITGGRASAKAGEDVPEKLTFTVPRYAPAEESGDNVDWRPDATDHPLGKFGQELDVTIIISSVVTGSSFEYRVGRYLITDWSNDDAGTVTVKAEGLLRRVKGAKLLTASSPSGTFVSETRRLIPPGMGVSFDPALTDRACPSGMAWSRDRLKNLQEIARAWPALLRTDEWGQLRFTAPLPAVPVPEHTIRDGRWGTLISAPRSDTRTDSYNTVIVTATGGAGDDVQGIAQITAGPMSVNGPYGAEVKEWSSDLLTDEAEAFAAAKVDLDNSMRPAVVIPVRCAPDPRLVLDTAVSIQRGDDAPVWGWVTAYDLPLTVDDGDMRIDVGVSA